jgi:hypothetical protein
MFPTTELTAKRITRKPIIGFGEKVEGYSIPVLNEREIRASAGILFFFVFLSLMLILFKNNFVLVKYVISLFFLDFLVRIFINPRYAPTLIIGRMIVGNQVPEYVGAAPKRFAWIIGLFLSALMFVFLVVVNAFSPITGITCLICLVFLFFESAFGICLGCKVYSLFYKDKVQYCPGEVCARKDRQPIQKISKAQVLIVLLFIASIFLANILVSDFYNRKPYDLFGIFTTTQNK